jgi:hypothetical protein
LGVDQGHGDFLFSDECGGIPGMNSVRVLGEKPPSRLVVSITEIEIGLENGVFDS